MVFLTEISKKSVEEGEGQRVGGWANLTIENLIKEGEREREKANKNGIFYFILFAEEIVWICN